MANITVGNEFDKQLYVESLFRSAKNDSFWSPMTGGKGSAVEVDRRPSKGGGAECNYGIRPYVPPRSVTNGPLDGQERNLSTFKDSLKLDKHREAVIDDGEQQEIEAFFSIDDMQEDYIREWVTDIYDALHFKAIFYEGGNPNIYLPDGIADKNSLTAGNKMGKDDLTTLYTIANTGKSRAFEPLRPLKMGGRNCYIYLCHPDVAQDLRLDMEGDWAQARERAANNPLFRNADMEWSDIVVVTDRRCPIELNSGGVPIATGALLGQQCLEQIVGKDPDIVKGEKDWGDQKGYAASMIMGVKAPEFNGSRYGSILVQNARTNVSSDDNLAEINYTNIQTSNQ